MIQVQCPSCAKSYSVAQEKLGRVVKCASCAQAFTLATATGETHRSVALSEPNKYPPQVARPEPVPASAKRLGRFEILDELGSGSFGTVYKARDTELDRIVALKVPRFGVLGGEEDARRFLREAKAAGQLHHPNIVPIHDAGHFEGAYYIASAFIEGETLRQKIAHRGKLTPHGAAKLIRKLALALHYAHLKGIIHRDVKPDNVMIDADGEPHVMDFGLARRDEENVLRTQEGLRMGTPAYMSPEQHAGKSHEADARSDLWSLGVMLYEMLIGERPFQGGNDLQMAYAVRETSPAPLRKQNAAISLDLETICLKCLAKVPDQRYPSCQHLAEELGRWLNDEPIQARRTGIVERAIRWTKRNPTLAALSSITAVLLILVTMVSLVAYLQTSKYLDTALSAGKQAEEALGREAAERKRAEKNFTQLKGAEKTRAMAQLDVLRRAEIGQVPFVIENLKPVWKDVAPRVQELLKDKKTSEKERIRLSLALLPHDRNQVQFLYQRLLEADPEEFMVIRDALAPFASQFSKPLWAAAQATNADREQRFRAACALATLDSEIDASKWEPLSSEVAQFLVVQNPLVLKTWLDALRPVRQSLTPQLHRIATDPTRGATERSLAVNIVADFAADRPEMLVDLIQTADAQQFAVMMPKLRALAPQTVPLLEAFLRKEPAADATTGQSDALCQGQANCGVALLQLGQAASVWPLLAHSPNPSRRSYMIHRLGPLGTDPRVLVDRLAVEPDVSVRRALILCLGGFREAQLGATTRESLVPTLLSWYENDPDAGIHGAADWLLRRWEQQDQLLEIDRRLATGSLEGGRQWYLTKPISESPDAVKAKIAERVGIAIPHTMTVVKGPAEFVYSNKELAVSARNQKNFELRPGPKSAFGEGGERTLRIERSFAIATKEVTVREYQYFQIEDLARRTGVRSAAFTFAPDPSGPQPSINPDDAGLYCNWLSKQEEIPESNWCYDTDGRQVADALLRSGYRLPTMEEWLYACRAGATSTWYYGDATELLPNYAWFLANARGRIWPVGQQKPNDFGLFDMYGNVYEWCTYGTFPTLWGGSYASESHELRMPYNYGENRVGQVYFAGFRVARTYP